MEIGDGEEFEAALLEPSELIAGLAFGAVAVAAGVIGDAGEGAAVALFDMAAEGRGAADLDGSQDTEMRDGRGLPQAVGGAMAPEDVGEFDGRAWHGAQACLRGRPRLRLSGRSYAFGHPQPCLGPGTDATLTGGAATPSA